MSNVSDNDDNQIIGRFCEFTLTNISELNIDFEKWTHTLGWTNFTWQMHRENKCLLKEGDHQGLLGFLPLTV